MLICALWLILVWIPIKKIVFFSICIFESRIRKNNFVDFFYDFVMKLSWKNKLSFFIIKKSELFVKWMCIPNKKQEALSLQHWIVDHKFVTSTDNRRVRAYIRVFYNWFVQILLGSRVCKLFPVLYLPDVHVLVRVCGGW